MSPDFWSNIALGALLLFGILLSAYDDWNQIHHTKEFWKKELREEILAELGASQPTEPAVAAEPESKEDWLKQSWDAITTMHAINDRIPDLKFSEQVDAIENATREIVTQVQSSKEKMEQSKQFFICYLPLAVQLLETYDRLYDMSAPGPNIKKTMKSIEDSLDTIVIAFQQQADQLVTVDLVSTTANIATLKAAMARQGLGMENPFAPKPEERSV